MISNILEPKFMQNNIILDLFYNNEEEKQYLLSLQKYLNSIFKLKEINVEHIIRQGNGITPYKGITFEYHVMHDAYTHKIKKKYEFLGGGEYVYEKYFGTGFGLGVRRFMLCDVIREK